MALVSPAEWDVAEAIAGIGYCNPFLPGRVELERRALGRRFVSIGPVVRLRPGASTAELFPNVPGLLDLAESIAAKMRARLAAGDEATTTELVVYEDLALYILYCRFMSRFDGLISRGEVREVEGGIWPEFLAAFERFFGGVGRPLPSGHRPEVVFAGFFQIERAFDHIYRRIVGASMPAARLRAAVWESIFTHDMRRYAMALHGRMADVPTLIVGPSGSGKELVARAVGLSSFIPFDVAKKRFMRSEAELYIPLNIAALSPTLIESELFGHVRGSFSSAMSDRDGWFQKCGPFGAVFLDEIGELDAAIQVKLLRVLEARQFQKVGSSDTIPFSGKVLAATNRDLAAEMRAGRFRGDLYYRLCADQITTPSLAEQLADRPDDLPELVKFIARDILVGPDGDEKSHEVDVNRLVDEVVDCIDRKLGRSYPWPGNFRELGQCVRSIMVRGTYRPAATGEAAGVEPAGPVSGLLRQVREGTLSRDEMLGLYVTLVYHQSGGNLVAAARLLKVDPRVVRRWLDKEFLARLEGGAAGER